MTTLYLMNLLNGHFDWLPAKKLVGYFLIQGDVIIILLTVIMIYEVKRWTRLKQR